MTEYASKELELLANAIVGKKEPKVKVKNIKPKKVKYTFNSNRFTKSTK